MTTQESILEAAFMQGFRHGKECRPEDAGDWKTDDQKRAYKNGHNLGWAIANPLI